MSYALLSIVDQRKCVSVEKKEAYAFYFTFFFKFNVHTFRKSMKNKTNLVNFQRL